MNILFVVGQQDDWPYAIPGVEVLTARHYLDENGDANGRPDTRVFNLCDPGCYQDTGYYVSMLAEARGHQPLPDIKAIEDLHANALLAQLAGPIEKLCRHCLAADEATTCTLDVWFGRCASQSCARLAEQLFNTFRLPLMRAEFARFARDWRLVRIRALALDEMDAGQLAQAAQAAQECVQSHCQRKREPAAARPALAILRTPGAAATPSNHGAIDRFCQAAEDMGLRAELVSRSDAGRIDEFDGLFIRDTTNVNDYTYQIARQAALNGLVVLDDPDSIVRCSNKIFQHELLTRHRLPTPATLLVHPDNLRQVIPAVGLPAILKQPDSAFSMGVVKVETPEQLEQMAAALFTHSALLLAQEYLPTAFDWRIGILDRKPLFACRYHMAAGHWQVIKHDGDCRYSEGLAEAVALDDVPADVVSLALAAANLIGAGFYGVDLKQHGGQCSVIEVNDNPNIDAGNEDGVLQDLLYQAVIGVMRERIDAARSCPS